MFTTNVCLLVHDVHRRRVREAPLLIYRVELEVPVRRLMMDEFALHKGHRYATVIACADTQQVVWIGEGRSREAIRPFFAWLGDAREQIEAVAMDMNASFDLEVKAQCPNAEVIYDRFHVVAKYGREVMDRVRVDQTNRLQRPARSSRAAAGCCCATKTTSSPSRR